MTLPGGSVTLTTEYSQRQRSFASGGAPRVRPLDGLAIGPWRLTVLIRRNRICTIYRARPAQESMGPGCYAIKVARHSVTGSCDGVTGYGDESLAIALLAREAAVLSEIADPHVVSMLGGCLSGQRPHLVLPHLEGVTLRRLLERLHGEGETSCSGLPVSFALWIARQMASALEALHTAGWLHGQVRPEHVIISPRGHATLIDLTQARRLHGVECDLDGTRFDMPAYAAPETFGSRGRLGSASDAYALGILLFEALSGRPPFYDPDPRRLGSCHRREAPPDIRQFRPEASLEVGELVRRMLAKEPLRRPTDEDMVRWLTELEIEELACS